MSSVKIAVRSAVDRNIEGEGLHPAEEMVRLHNQCNLAVIQKPGYSICSVW